MWWRIVVLFVLGIGLAVAGSDRLLDSWMLSFLGLTAFFTGLFDCTIIYDDNQDEKRRKHR